VATAYRRFDDVQDLPARALNTSGRCSHCVCERSLLTWRVGETELELGLHQGDEPRSGRELDSAVELWQSLGEGHVREVRSDDIHPVGNELDTQRAEVRTLQVDDPWIAPKRSEELAVAGVDGVHARCSSLEEHNGKAAGRSAEVQGNGVLDVDAEGVQRSPELRLAPQRHVACDANARAALHE
jgi:hypothetical protein